MLQSLYSAATAVKSQQTNIDTIANNLANVNTEGFKKSRMDFKDALYERMLSPTDNSPQMNLQRGAGAIISQTKRVFDQGAFRETGRMMDFAIEGDAFFQVSLPDGTTAYTRDGNFSFSIEQGGNFLVNASGNYILNAEGGRISVPNDMSEFSIDQAGNIAYKSGEQSVQAGKIALSAFPNKAGLLQVSENNYLPSANSGAPIAPEGATVTQGKLEMSNVNMAEEMTRMVRSQRAFQLASRAISVTDQMASAANTIRS